MSLWFCQKCKCTSDFEECEGCGGPADELFFVPRAELEELVGALEECVKLWSFMVSDKPHGFVKGESIKLLKDINPGETAAKCRAKYLEVKRLKHES